MKKLFALAIVAIATVAGSADSYAACTQYLKVYRNLAYGTAADNNAWYYGVQRTAGLPTVTYFFVVNETDQALNTAMDNAYANGLTVRVNANATACPTTGNFRYMGVANWGQSYILN